MYKKLIATIALLFASTSIHAQTKTDDYGGLGNYPVPEVAGGSSEFQYCVVYAKRAWRVANMIDGGAISVSKAKAWARAELGRNAAAVEIEDFERFEKKEYSSSEAMAGERFYRCATRLRLNPEPRHKSNAEFCFRSIKLLDFVARMRADGKSQDQVKLAVSKKMSVDPRFLNNTVELAFAGQSIAEGSTLIEDTFSSCFAESGERQLKSQQ